MIFDQLGFTLYKNTILINKFVGKFDITSNKATELIENFVSVYF